MAAAGAEVGHGDAPEGDPAFEEFARIAHGALDAVVHVRHQVPRRAQVGVGSDFLVEEAVAEARRRFHRHGVRDRGGGDTVAGLVFEESLHRRIAVGLDGRARAAYGGVGVEVGQEVRISHRGLRAGMEGMEGAPLGLGACLKNAPEIVAQPPSAVKRPRFSGFAA